MDGSKFTSDRTGCLIAISSQASEFAFVPNPLPPDWEFSNDLWPMVAEARQLLGELDGIGRTLQNPDLLMRPLLRREALSSSSLEGTISTPAQMFLFELQQQKKKPKGDDEDSTKEVVNYSTALRNGFDYLQNEPISLELVRELHRWLLEGVRGEDKSPGKFRTNQVQVGSDARYMPPPAEEMYRSLEELAPYLEVPSGLFDPLVECYILHYQFEAIHPFRDGNGRVGRLLLALMTCLWCGISKPWLYMSAYFEKHKDEYVGLLFNVSTRGDWTEWVRYCLRGTIRQAKDAIKRCDLLQRLKEQMHEKAGSGPGRLHLIVDRLFDSPILSIPTVARDFGVGYPTAKNDVDRLVDLEILEPMANSHHPKYFAAWEIAKIAFQELDED